MKRTAIVGLPLLAALMLVATLALAGKTQVNPTSLKAAGPHGAIYGRSDGVYQDATSGSAYSVENGQRARTLGVGYRSTFAFGDNKGISQLDQSAGGTCAGNATTVPCIASFGDAVNLVWFPLVTATLPLDMTATGLDIAGDQTDDDGNEVDGGILGASGRPFIIGDDPAFYFCATVALADVSGSDLFMTGFRRAEPFNATFDNYLDLASIGSVSGDIKIETILNNAATTVTDTTDNWADTATHKLCTNVSGSGVVTYTVDGAAPTTTASFTFDDGDPVIPFVHLLQDADLMDSAVITLWEVGYTQ